MSKVFSAAPPADLGHEVVVATHRRTEVRSFFDTTRLSHDTGFMPAFDVAAAVADCAAWRAGHPR